MTNYHAVLVQNGRESFHVFRTSDYKTARRYLLRNFPQSRIVQLESEAQRQAREARIHALAEWV